jgi:hypothetical protein
VREGGNVFVAVVEWSKRFDLLQRGHHYLLIHCNNNFEDTKGIITSRRPKNGRQYYDQERKNKMAA